MDGCLRSADGERRGRKPTAGGEGGARGDVVCQQKNEIEKEGEKKSSSSSGRFSSLPQLSPTWHKDVNRGFPLHDDGF